MKNRFFWYVSCATNTKHKEIEHKLSKKCTKKTQTNCASHSIRLPQHAHTTKTHNSQKLPRKKKAI